MKLVLDTIKNKIIGLLGPEFAKTLLEGIEFA